MKMETFPRGLFLGTKGIAETEDEQCEICFNSAAWPRDYIDDAKECAANILRENDIDPDSLFDWLEVEVIDEIARTKVEGKFRRWTVLQRDSLSAEYLKAIDETYQYETLSPEAHQAITVILQWHAVQRDLADPERKSALCNGIRFATAIDHLDANLAWWPIVKRKIHQTVTAIANNAKRRKKIKQTAEDDWQPLVDQLVRKSPRMSFTNICDKVGSELKPRISGRTIRRHCKKPI